MIFSSSNFWNKCSVFSTLREPSEKRKDLQALTLVGPTRDNSVLDSLAVLHFENRLFINIFIFWLFYIILQTYEMKIMNFKAKRIYFVISLIFVNSDTKVLTMHLSDATWMIHYILETEVVKVRASWMI